MPSAMRRVRTGLLAAMPLVAALAAHDGYAAATPGSPCAPPGGTHDCARPYAAIMDLWLATSLGLIVIYCRRRRRTRR